MAKVIIFGLNDFASLAHFYLKHDTDHEVVAFTAHRAFCEKVREFEQLSVVPFEQIEHDFSVNEYCLFAPMAPNQVNRTRASIYQEIKNKGYTFINYVSSKATTFCDLKLGENCFILENNVIQPYVRIGNNVILWSGNHIGHHSVIGNHVMFTSHVVLSGHCDVGDYAYFGVNSTIRDGIQIAEGSYIGMSAAITKNTEKWQIYKGIPGRASGDSRTI